MASAYPAGPGRWDMHSMRAIVTGGSKGLGLACATELLELGAEVLITARGEAELQLAQTQLSERFGNRIHIIAADVSCTEGRESVIAKAAGLWSSALDVLVNNVGTNRRTPAGEATDEDYETMVRTNQDIRPLCSTIRTR